MLGVSTPVSPPVFRAMNDTHQELSLRCLTEEDLTKYERYARFLYIPIFYVGAIACLAKNYGIRAFACGNGPVSKDYDHQE